MKTQLSTLGALALSGALLSIPQLARADQISWTGASGADQNWSTPGNWLGDLVPGGNDDVLFGDTGTDSTVSNVNNVVDSAFSGMIQSLQYATSNQLFHTTLIEPGQTLTIKGAFTVGTETDAGNTNAVFTTITGPQGTLVVDNTNADFVVRQGLTGTEGGNSALRATLDASGLGTITANVSRLLVGTEGPGPRPAGTLYLAATNRITASGTAPAIAMGGAGGPSSHNSGNSSYIYLGDQNVLNADSITVGRLKQGGNSSITFNTNLFPNPTAQFRGADGVGRVGEWYIADANGRSEGTGGSGNTVGICDFSGGMVDALVDTMILGNQAGNHNPSGTLTFDQGTIDVNTLVLGNQTQTGDNYGSGTVNVNGTATLVVNTNLALTQTTGGNGVANSTATLNLNGGKVNVLGTLSNGGGKVSVSVVNGQLNLPPHSSLLAGSVTVDGGSISNLDVLQATNALSIYNGGVISSPSVFDMGSDGSSIWDVSGTAAGGLVVSNKFSGAGTLTGNLTMLSGSVLDVSGSGQATPQPLSLINNLSLNGTALQYDLSSSGAFGNDMAYVYGNLTLQGDNGVLINSINGTLDTGTPYTLFSYSGTLAGNASNLHVSGPLAASRYTFTFNTGTPNAINLSVGGSGSANLTWVGGSAGNVWDIKGATNWSNGGSPDRFYNLDAVTFDDTGTASSPVDLVGTLYPASITMNNATKSYVFSGSGALNSGALSIMGGGSLTISNAGDNVFNNASGTGVDVESGSVTFANDGNNSFIGGLNVNSGSATIANAGSNDFESAFGTALVVNGALTFDQPVDAVVNADITGIGTLTKAGTNTLTLGGDVSNFGTAIQVNSGILKAGSPRALPTSGLNVANGATFDIGGNAYSLGTGTITVVGAGFNGQGAIINSSGDPNYVTYNIQNVTLTGDTTFGGTGRWDLRSPGGTTGDASQITLSTGGQPYNLTKVGSNGVAIVSVTVDPALADIDVKEGTIQFEGNTTSMGNPSKTLTVESGATLQFYRTTNLWDKKIVLNGDGIANTMNNASGDTMIIGPVTLNGDCIMNVGGTSLTLAGAVDGTGSLTKASGDTLVLVSPSYTGNTVVQNGTLVLTNAASLASSNITVAAGATLDVSARTDGTETVAANQTLQGGGAVNGSVVVNSGGTISPGATDATLTISSAATLNGTTMIGLDPSARTNDVIAAASIQFGGTLVLTNISGALSGGQSFKPFDAGSYSGSFDTISPSTPGNGMQWDTTKLASQGILSVIGGASGPTIGSPSVSGGNFTFDITGGSAGGTFYVLTSTNLADPLSSWTPVLTNQFDTSGTFNFTNPVESQAQQYFIIQEQ